MSKRRGRESDLYPLLRKWMLKHFECFKAEVEVGLRHSRADVLGVRDVGGKLSGEIEAFIIEAKRGGQPFATASGQALGYRIYADRVYLADRRAKEFTRSELEIASHLGIGLIRVHGNSCIEVMSSPRHQPIPRMSLELIEKLALGRCQICGTFFDIGKDKESRSCGLSQARMDKAVRSGKGLMFWNHGLADRKRKYGLEETKAGWSYQRRFICAECMETIFAPLVGSATT